MCRTSLIRSALENTDPGVSNDGPKVEFRPFGADLIIFEMAKLSNHKIFLSLFLPMTNPITRQSGHFKISEIGSKKLEFDFWPTVRYARVSTLQRISNQRHTAHWRVCD